MKRLLRASSIFFFILSVLIANPGIALASEGDGGHELEAEVHGYHVTLVSQKEWAKGENIVTVTLTDEMGMAISNAGVEILFSPKSDGHEETGADAHGAGSEHNSMPSSMDVNDHESTEPATHEEEGTGPIAMQESHQHGTYTAEAYLESSGEYEARVFFHVNGEMLQADFAVEVPGVTSRTVVLWSFALVNVGLITFAGIVRNQSASVKGKQ